MSEPAAKKARTALGSLELNADRFIELLRKLIGEAKGLQNNPSQGFVPRENAASDYVLELLRPHTKEQGGPLEVERVEFTEGRGNVIIKYPGASTKSIAFVGSHMDVVPANPETWERDPFELSVEGDKLYGRGTTDCLGHVAMITDLLLGLCENKVALQRTLTVVFIVSEENGEIEGIGVDKLMTTGKLDHIKDGPVLWVDCADSQPCVGTAGAITWHLKAVGHLFHSGLPHKGINGVEMAMEASKVIQRRFYEDFPAHPDEKRYNFATPSTMKPTQVEVSQGSINQIPAWCKVSGDIRLTPFYEVKDVMAAVDRYVAEINADVTQLDSRGPVSKYKCPTTKGEKQGVLEFEWGESPMEGIACSLDSDGHRALCDATKEILGEAKPYAICGSLPLVRDLQRGGFDVQLTGYGLSSAYHADNEFCKLSDMQNGFRILRSLLGRMS